MPVFTGYYATLQINRLSPGGIWNISHSLDDPNYMQNAYGMSWIEMRRKMRADFTSKKRDAQIIERVKQKVNQFIPLRSGHLMDHIFKTMRIIRSSWYNSHYFCDFSYEWPTDRPRYIHGKTKHTPPETGRGYWGPIKLTEPIPMSRVSTQRVTATGLTAIYNLNDPQAEANVPPEIERVGLLEIEDDYATLFNINLQIMI